MEVEGSVALVTGGNRGFGASLCAALLERGASKINAGIGTGAPMLGDDAPEVLADHISRTVKSALSGELSLLYPSVA